MEDKLPVFSFMTSESSVQQHHLAAHLKALRCRQEIRALTKFGVSGVDFPMLPSVIAKMTAALKNFRFDFRVNI